MVWGTYGLTQNAAAINFPSKFLAAYDEYRIDRF